MTTPENIDNFRKRDVKENQDKQPDKKKSDKPEKPKGPFNFKSWIYWVYFAIFIFLVGLFFSNNYSSTQDITWLEFEREMIRNHDVKKIVVVNKETAEIYIKKDKLKLERHKEVSEAMFSDSLPEGPHYTMNIGSVETFEKKLEEAQNNYEEADRIPVKYETRQDWFGNILSWLIPIGLLILFWIFILGRIGRGAMGGGGASPFNFGKSSARLMDKENRSKVTFNDVAGLEEAKAEVKEIVDFLKNPEIYTKLGAKIPKGVMLIGPPGTGKTLMAKAVAGEAQVPFFSLSGSEFVEMFVGVGASRVRDLFKKAKEKAPCIIFIDEIDAIGRSRGKAQSFNSNDERENTLNQLLTEMDGFGTNTGVIVMAATNRADVLDSALLRPGRFDRHINLDMPNKKERKAIFEVHIKEIKISEDVNLDHLAAQTPGFSGADIANVCNEAALIAARRKKDKVERQDFMDAMDRIVAGLEKRSKVISPEEKKRIAYHEAGHAVVSWMLKHVDSLLKVSIVPRGRSLGAAWYLPEEHELHTKSQLFERICAALGGRASEEIVFGEVSSGALDDLEKVTKQAYTMITAYGLNEKLGNISYYDSSGSQEYTFQKPYSEHTAKLIDDEVRDLVSKAYNKTKEILTEHRDELEELAERLLEKEVIYAEDLEKILGKRPKKAKQEEQVKEKIKEQPEEEKKEEEKVEGGENEE